MIEPEADVSPTGELDSRPKFFPRRAGLSERGANGFGYFCRNKSTAPSGARTRLKEFGPPQAKQHTKPHKPVKLPISPVS